MSSIPRWTCDWNPSLKAVASPVNCFLTPFTASWTAPLKSPAIILLMTFANVSKGFTSHCTTAFPTPTMTPLRAFIAPPMDFSIGNVFSNHPTMSCQCVTNVATRPMMNINGMAFNANPRVLEATAPAFCAVESPSCAAVAFIADICVCTSSTPVAFNALLNKVADAVLPVKDS